MKEKDLFDMTPSEVKSYFQGKRKEWESDPDGCIDRLNRASDKFSTNIQPALSEPGRRFLNEIFELSKSQSISKDKKITKLVNIRDLYRKALTQIKFSDKRKYAAMFLMNGKEVYIHPEMAYFCIEILNDEIIRLRESPDYKVKKDPPVDISNYKLFDIIKTEFKDEFCKILNENKIINTGSMAPYPKYNKPGLLATLLQLWFTEGWTIKEFNGKSKAGMQVINNTFATKIGGHDTWDKAAPLGNSSITKLFKR